MPETLYRVEILNKSSRRWYVEASSVTKGDADNIVKWYRSKRPWVRIRIVEIREETFRTKW